MQVGTASGYADACIQCDLLQPGYITTFTTPDEQPHHLLTSTPTPPEQSRSDADLSEVDNHNMSMGIYHQEVWGVYFNVGLKMYPSQVTEESQESQGNESS